MRPEIRSFSYSVAESQAIAIALVEARPWEHKGVEVLKSKLKDFHLGLTRDLCCYCQRSLHKEFKMVIDVEHVFPTSKYKLLTFEVWNLSASCKRCNMWMKNDKLDFINNSAPNFFSSEHYFFIHPNFDNAAEHMLRFSYQEGTTMLVKYIFGSSEKARFTYDFFKLSLFEIDAFDRAQAAGDPSVGAEEDFDWIRERVKALQDRFN